VQQLTQSIAGRDRHHATATRLFAAGIVPEDAAWSTKDVRQALPIGCGETLERDVLRDHEARSIVSGDA
jgi:hypothetical protein